LVPRRGRQRPEPLADHVRRAGAADPQHKQGGQDADREQRPPRDRLRTRARNGELELLQRRRQQSIGPGDQILTAQLDFRLDKHFPSRNALARDLPSSILLCEPPAKGHPAA